MKVGRRGAETRSQQSFWRNDDGSMVVFSLFILITMLVVAGMGVDLARYEASRSQLQTALDRGVLAAASRTQTMDGRQVVEEYLATAGLADTLQSFEYRDTGVVTEVIARAEVPMSTIFLSLVGIDNLTPTAASTAEQGASLIEVSLVVDISSSIVRTGRLEDLRLAGEVFITDMFDLFRPEQLSISIVPYSAQVSMPQAMMDQFNVRENDTHTGCLDLPDQSYRQTRLNLSRMYDETAMFDQNMTPDYSGAPWRWICWTDPAGNIVPWSRNETQLVTAFRNLPTFDHTSTDIGMRWGLSMLDPGFAPIVDGMVTAGALPEAMSAYPLPYGESVKVLVLLTDGEVTMHHELRPNYRSGMSNVWRDGDQFYIEIGTGASREYVTFPGNNRVPNRQGNRIMWPEVWENIGVYTFGDAMAQGIPGMNGRTYTQTELVNRYAGNVKNDRLDAVCDLLREEEIIVYTIGYEIVDSGVQRLVDCASSPAHFFRPSTDEVSGVYAAIADQLGQLRLTQ